ncbi:unnamed protein product [Rotaria sp. Silwood2]|nr:unnamed protein product [Rotaria sp. Silwood2]CAF2812791.1 unnamed protein product [Rotaria sp. Silwood2]CAF2895598.1 unnamed protein product [Rotaria sp. Silwood2]CAF4163424.1 unnamed protein product [Rotaria sp. Silwood2]CAF4212058.1 unnamed protein product [Rotaria sp. Silwood2]
MIRNKQLPALRTLQIDANYLGKDFNSYHWDIFSSIFHNNKSHPIDSFRHEFQLFLCLLISYNRLLSSPSLVAAVQ